MNERQLKIIGFAQENKPFKNKDLVVFFDKKYSRETITRDLSFLCRQNILTKKGAGAFVEYSLSETYELIKEIDIESYFSVPYLQRNVNERFNFNIFQVLENDIFTKSEYQYLEKLQNQFIKNISQYDSQTLINKEFERIMIEFSWKSSVIEGNTYSLLNTEALLKENIKDETKTEKEAQMILNHKDAFNDSIQNKERFLSIQYSDVEYLHSVLTKKLDITKNIRNGAVGITGTKYKPLDNSFQIEEALQKMMKLINKKNSFFEKSFLSLLLISYIQAFEDGNKRTARMFSNAILLTHNSIPLSYRVVDVIEYKKASILFYEKNNISYFKKIFLTQVADAVNNYFK
jgi:Fic family protein